MSQPNAASAAAAKNPDNVSELRPSSCVLDPLLSQCGVHHLSPCRSPPGLSGGQDRPERALGHVCRGRHARRSHDAGLHLLEPLDRHGNLEHGDRGCASVVHLVVLLLTC